ncbi:MAG: amino acid decarboxylase [Actinobacteria bacterium]|nr:amino acid decarboxylase [Actinomycetota bacterium]
MDPDAFRRHGHAVVDWIADYLDGVGDLPVLSPLPPGDVTRSLPGALADRPEPMADILRDLDDVVLPGITHWNHPAFHAYFAITGSGPGILGEAVTAALNVNGMLWRTSPAATELEQVTLDWLRQLLGLDAGLSGVIVDTASVATMTALAAARERADLGIRERGMAGRDDLPALRVYTSTHAHSSVEKGAITIGLGRDGVRAVPVDADFRMDVDALEEAIRSDLAAGVRPLAVVATVGTTSTTSIDPVPAIATALDRLRSEVPGGIWLHVDGAYGGTAAMLAERRHVLAGVEQADSFVVNPHKWLFTPIDCTAFYVREPEVLRRAFSLVPEYLRTTDAEDVTNYMDWGVQLGRRFRALKLWMVLRYFGRDGLEARLRFHLELAERVTAWVDAHPVLERLAPVPFSTVCFRARPAGIDDEDELRRLNAGVLDAVNRSGEAYLSHTELDGRYTLRLAIGNLRTTPERLDRTLAAIDRELSART